MVIYIPLVPLIPLAQAQITWTEITLPTTISSSGYYRINNTESFNQIGDSALTIDADNVWVDGNNTSLSFDSSGFGFFCDSTNHTGITISNISLTILSSYTTAMMFTNVVNLLVANYTMHTESDITTYYAIRTDDCSNVILTGLSLSGQESAGVYLSGITTGYYNISDSSFSTMEHGIRGDAVSADTLAITDCNFTRLNTGLMLAYGGGDATIQNNRFLTSTSGVDINGENFIVKNNIFDHASAWSNIGDACGALVLTDTNATVIDNVFMNNFHPIIYDPTNLITTIQNNYFILNQITFYFGGSNPESTLNFYNNYINDYGLYASNYWNTWPDLPTAETMNANLTKQIGDKIYGTGNYIGGNYWANPSGTGWSQTGTADEDGFITEPFDLFGDGTVFDYLPLAYAPASPLASPTPTPTYNPSYPVEGQTQFYFLSTTHTVNENLAYELSPIKGTTQTSVSTSFAGTEPVDFGFMAWVVHSNDEADTPIVGSSVTATFSRSTNGTGYQSGTATASTTPLVMGMNAIKVMLFLRYDYGAWVPTASYITDRLLEKEIETSTWNFTLYTNVTYSATEAFVTMYWGGEESDASGVYGIVFDTPLPQEVALATGMSGDFFGMIIYPYLYIIGELFYGIVIFYIGGVLYLRHKNLSVLLIMALLWGSTSGIGALIPIEAYRVVYVFALLIITAVLYKVAR